MIMKNMKENKKENMKMEKIEMGKNKQKEEKEMMEQKIKHKEQKNHIMKRKTRTNIRSKRWGGGRNWCRGTMRRRCIRYQLCRQFPPAGRPSRIQAQPFYYCVKGYPA
jgi:hypothetical protein